MKRYGIILIVAIATATAHMGYAQEQDVRDGHVAAVVNMRGRYVGSVSFSLPKGTTQQTAEEVWERVKSATGWQFGAARATEDNGVSIQADVLGTREIDLSGMSPAWPFIYALSDYSTVALVFLTGRSTPVRGSGDFTNRYITAEWSQSQGVRYYHVTITDASFRSIEQLRTRTGEKPVENPSDPAPGGPWILLGILAVVAGVIAYGVARLVVVRRNRG